MPASAARLTAVLLIAALVIGIGERAQAATAGSPAEQPRIASGWAPATCRQRGLEAIDVALLWGFQESRSRRPVNPSRHRAPTRPGKARRQPGGLLDHECGRDGSQQERTGGPPIRPPSLRAGSLPFAADWANSHAKPPWCSLVISTVESRLTRASRAWARISATMRRAASERVRVEPEGDGAGGQGWGAREGVHKPVNLPPSTRAFGRYVAGAFAEQEGDDEGNVEQRIADPAEGHELAEPSSRPDWTHRR